MEVHVFVSFRVFDEKNNHVQNANSHYGVVLTSLASREWCVLVVWSSVLTSGQTVSLCLQSPGILPVCRDFKLGLCKRPRCKYVHIIDGECSRHCL